MRLRQWNILLIAVAGAVLLSYANIKFPNHLPQISAHRGASRQAPENTLAAFQLAVDQQTDFIEIDVRTTADGAQICLHDRSLKRTTGLDKAVKDVALADLRGLSAGKWFDPKFASERVPQLEEICALVSKNNKAGQHYCRLYVDCKDIVAPVVVATLGRYALLDSAVFYGDAETLLAIRNVSANARLMPPYPGSDKMQATIAALKPYAFDVDWQMMNADLVAQCHAAGVRVFSDLLGDNDKPQRYRDAIRFNIDLIQTDDVAAVRQTMADEK